MKKTADHSARPRTMVRGVLDDIDQKIIVELRRDGRLSNVNLARRVGLSPSPCWTRVRDLEKRGVIVRYSAVIDQAMLGLKETIWVDVTLHAHGGEAIDAFAKAASAMPEIIEAYVVAGSCDFHLKVAVADTAGYERFLREKLHKAPGVHQVRTTLVLRRIVCRASS